MIKVNIIVAGSVLHHDHIEAFYEGLEFPEYYITYQILVMYGCIERSLAINIILFVHIINYIISASPLTESGFAL